MKPDLALGRERARVAQRMLDRGYAPLLYAALDRYPFEKGWQNAPVDHVPAALRANPALNLGWRCGVQPNGKRLLGLDDDGELDVVQTLLGELPETWTQATPSGGCHVVFTVPPGIPFTNSQAILVGGSRHKVDVRCDGAALCLAPSQRQDGVYRVMHARPIAALPERWVTALRFVEPPRAEAPPEGTAPSLERALAYTAHCEPAISGSGGHRATFRVALKAREFGLGINEIMEVLRVYNQRCAPQWTERELRHKATQALGGRIQVGGKLCARAAAQRGFPGGSQ